jgi:hypothetical protein
MTATLNTPSGSFIQSGTLSTLILIRLYSKWMRLISYGGKSPLEHFESIMSSP